MAEVYHCDAETADDQIPFAEGIHCIRLFGENRTAKPSGFNAREIERRRAAALN